MEDAPQLAAGFFTALDGLSASKMAAETFTEAQGVKNAWLNCCYFLLAVLNDHT